MRLVGLCLGAFLILTSGSGRAQDGVAQFYKGKQINIVVGTTAGGGYDAYARFIARHLGEHVPGNPSVVVSNMPGAGSNLAAYHVAVTAPKDGTVIGAIHAGALLEPLIGTTTVRHDPNRFQLLGSANDDVYVCLARKDAPVKTFAEALETPLIMGASMASSSADFAMTLNNVLGTKFKIVIGYNGSRSIMLAMEKGEVQGACGFAWPSISVTNPNWFGEEGQMRLLAQTHVQGYPELNKAGVPRASEFARTPEQRELMELFFSHTSFGRPYIVAAEAPSERVAALRKSFMATMRDPVFMAEAQRAGMDIDAVDGVETQRLVRRFYEASPEIIRKVKQALQPPQ
jgi:tripartite-type tricarboxylate transporter receptor subunit TctC